MRSRVRPDANGSPHCDCVDPFRIRREAGHAIAAQLAEEFPVSPVESGAVPSRHPLPPAAGVPRSCRILGCEMVDDRSAVRQTEGVDESLERDPPVVDDQLLKERDGSVMSRLTSVRRIRCHEDRTAIGLIRLGFLVLDPGRVGFLGSVERCSDSAGWMSRQRRWGRHNPIVTVTPSAPRSKLRLRGTTAVCPAAIGLGDHLAGLNHVRAPRAATGELRRNPTCVALPSDGRGCVGAYGGRS